MKTLASEVGMPTKLKTFDETPIHTLEQLLGKYNAAKIRLKISDMKSQLVEADGPSQSISSSTTFTSTRNKVLYCFLSIVLHKHFMRRIPYMTKFGF